MVIRQTNSMRGINSYGNELTQEDIERRNHRGFVGGLREELGKLQYDFLREQGLKPFHKLLDIGCGCLRGGLHYVKYLEDGNYYGLDVNNSLIQAGMLEIKEAGLEEKHPRLLVDDQFRLDKFNEKFDFMVSISLFTHLPMNIIIRCLSEVKKHLKPGGFYFSTLWASPYITIALYFVLRKCPGLLLENIKLWKHKPLAQPYTAKGQQCLLAFRS